MTISASTVHEREETELDTLEAVLDISRSPLERSYWGEEDKRAVRFSFNIEPTSFSILPNTILKIIEVGTRTSGKIILSGMGGQPLEVWPSSIFGFPFGAVGLESFPSAENLWKTASTGAPSIEEELPRELYERIYALSQIGGYNAEEIDIDAFEGILRDAIIEGGRSAIHQLDRLINQGVGPPEVIFDVLRMMGKIKYKETHQSRLRLLEKHLGHSSRWARDGAALGLASLEDKSALPALREAVDREVIPDLKKDLQQVVNYLEKLEK